MLREKKKARPEREGVEARLERVLCMGCDVFFVISFCRVNPLLSLVNFHMPQKGVEWEDRKKGEKVQAQRNDSNTKNQVQSLNSIHRGVMCVRGKEGAGEGWAKVNRTGYNRGR